jgi:hypothetical protein
VRLELDPQVIRRQLVEDRVHLDHDLNEGGIRGGGGDWAG